MQMRYLHTMLISPAFVSLGTLSVLPLCRYLRSERTLIVNCVGLLRVFVGYNVLHSSPKSSPYGTIENKIKMWIRNLNS